MQHIVAVLPVLDTQAQPELRVTPNVIIHRTARLLRGQNQMYAKASPYLRHAD